MYPLSVLEGSDTWRDAKNGHPSAPGFQVRPIVRSVPPWIRSAAIFSQPEPSAPSFVKKGDTVQAGDTLLIIEAMKVMNPIRAPRGGRLVQLLVNSGDPVESGELLMIVE